MLQVRLEDDCWAHPCGEGHASAGEKTVLSLGGHHAELALVDECLQVLDLLLERGLLDVLCGVRVGGLVAGVGVGEGRHSEGLSVDCCESWCESASNAEAEDTSQCLVVFVKWMYVPGGEGCLGGYGLESH